MGELLEDGHLPHDLGHTGWVAAQLILLDQFDSNLGFDIISIVVSRGSWVEGHT